MTKVQAEKNWATVMTIGLIKDRKIRVEFANNLRGLAILGVLACHYLGIFWNEREVASRFANFPYLDPAVYPSPRWIQIIPDVDWFDLGAVSVGLFFIISGFVIPFGLPSATRTSFFIGRFLRLYPTYIAGFLVSLLSLKFAAMIFATEFPHGIRAVLPHFVPGIHDLLFARPIDGVIWTLEIEIKFYFICMVVMPLFRQKSLKDFYIPLFLSAAQLYLFLYSGRIDFEYSKLFSFNASYLTFIFIGVAGHYAYERLISQHEALLLSSFLLTSFIWQLKNYPEPALYRSAASYLLSFALFCIAYKLPRFFENNACLTFFANISFPLYASHGLFGYAFMAYLLASGYNNNV